MLSRGVAIRTGRDAEVPREVGATARTRSSIQSRSIFGEEVPGLNILQAELTVPLSLAQIEAILRW